MTEFHDDHPLPARTSPSADGVSRPEPSLLMASGLTVMAAPGGGEIQMLSIRRELAMRGARAHLWRPWEDRLAECDLLHLFGSLPEHEGVAAAARRQGVPVVLSPIAWFDLPSYWRQPRRLAGRCAAAGRFLVRAAVPRLPSWRRRLYHAVDLLMPNSNAEAEQLMRYFGVAAEKIHVAPNGADPSFAEADASLFLKRHGLVDFALAVGRIEPRKNQLRLIRALRWTGIPLVVIGDPVPGHEDYYQACRKAGSAGTLFLAALEHEDPLLASAYAACGCLVLPSWFETPGLVALEAAMSGTPLVLPRGGSADEYFGRDAEYVRAGSERSIREAVVRALGKQRSPALAARVSESFSWEAATEVTRQGYQRVLEERNRA